MIQLKRGPVTSLNSTILEPGQPGYDTTNHYLKIGDGATKYSDLPHLNYFNEYSQKYTIAKTNQWLTANNFVLNLNNGDITGIGSLYFNDNLDSGSEGIAFYTKANGVSQNWKDYTYDEADWVYLRYNHTNRNLFLGGQIVPSYYGHINKALWSGTAVDGDTISVDLNGYSLLAVEMDGQGTKILANVHGPNVYGCGGGVTINNGRHLFLFGSTYTSSTKKLTIRECVRVTLSTAANTFSGMTITDIVGLL